MNNKRRTSYLIALALIVALVLTGCGKEPVSSGGKVPEDRGDVQLLGKKEDDTKVEEVKNTWTDEKGLVKIWKEGEEYYIHSDLDKWEEAFNISDYTERHYMNGILVDRNLVISGLDQKVKDIRISQIEGYSGSFEDEHNFPIIFFLMESGDISWMHAYPALDTLLEDGTIYEEKDKYVYDYLAYLKDIKDFVYENDGEGYGNKSLFAIDKDGLKYNMKHVLDYQGFRYGFWVSYAHGEDFDEVNLDFTGEDTITMYTKKEGQEIVSQYEGSYTMYLDDNSSVGYRAPSIGLDLDLIDPVLGRPIGGKGFKGTYMLSMEGPYTYLFFHTDGDFFYSDGEVFQFDLDYYEGEYGMGADEFSIWYLTDEMFMDYFLDVMPHINEMVKKHVLMLWIG